MTARAHFRPMTDEERRTALALGLCRFPVASFEKKFGRDLRERALEDKPLITDKQSAVLSKLAHRYRKQIANILLSQPNQ